MAAAGLRGTGATASTASDWQCSITSSGTGKSLGGAHLEVEREVEGEVEREVEREVEKEVEREVERETERGARGRR